MACDVPPTLYILGDWLDGYLGADEVLLGESLRHSHPLYRAFALTQTFGQYVDVFLMAGNKDLLLDVRFAKQLNMHYLPQGAPYNAYTVLHHGDALCLDDVGYQRYRCVMDTQMVRGVLLGLPLWLRIGIKDAISAFAKRQKSQKSAYKMDVSRNALESVFAQYTTLIHGHTHRPARHVSDNKMRLVLGDWRLDGHEVNAKLIAHYADGHFGFIHLIYSPSQGLVLTQVDA